MQLEDTRLELNRSGKYEIRWTEERPGERSRTRTRSTGTSDRTLAEAFRRTFVEADRVVSNHAFDTRVDALLDAYEAGHIDTNQITDSQRWSLKPIRRELGSHVVGDLGPETFAKYMRTRRKDVVDGTIRRELGALNTALRWALKNGVLARDTILPHVPLPAESEARDKWLTEDEAGQLWDHAVGIVGDQTKLLSQRRIGVFICIALETAGRSQAIETLTWDRVNFASGLIDLREPGRRRSKKRRVSVPMSDKLGPVLKDWWVACGGPDVGPVLVSTNSTYKAFRREIEGLKLDITRHGLRHTWATLKLQKGVDIWQVAGVLGDSIETTQKHYGHHCPDHLRSAVNA